MKNLIFSVIVCFIAIPAFTQTSPDSFCKVGSVKKGKTIYESVYTTKQRNQAINDALSLLIAESKKENKTVLLYSDKTTTPSSQNLASAKTRQNKSLWGGVEKTKKGNYYMLLYVAEGAPLYREKMN